jgi:hypothetical protein
MVDCETWGASQQADWKAAFQHIAQVIAARSIAKGAVTANGKPRIRPIWNPLIEFSGMPAEATVPDQSVIDSCAVIGGLDVYNAVWCAGANVSSAADRIKCWQSTYYGMDNHVAILQATGMDTYWPEFGAGPVSGGANGIANDAAFIDWAASQVARIRELGKGKFLGASYWDLDPSDATTRVSDGSQPQVAAELKKYYAATDTTSFIGDPLW